LVRPGNCVRGWTQVLIQIFLRFASPEKCSLVGSDSDHLSHIQNLFLTRTANLPTFYGNFSNICPTRNKQKQKFIFDQNFVSIKLILVLLFTGGRRKKMSQFFKVNAINFKKTATFAFSYRP